MPTIRVDDIGLYYEEVGEGFPLVLLHPWPADHAMWMFQIPIFSESYRVITPDSRGLGRSDKPEAGYTLKRLSDDVNELLNKLEIKKAFIVGNSLGGLVAQKFTIEHTEKVQGTIWIGAPSIPTDDIVFPNGKNVPFADVYLEALKSKGYLHFWETVWKPTMSYQFHENFVKTYTGSYFIRYLFEERYARLNRNPLGVIRIMEALQREDSMDAELAKVKVPAAIVTGDGDDAQPSCEKQHRAMPHIQYLMLKNSGHFGYMDNPEVFNNFMRDFLNRCGQSP